MAMKWRERISKGPLPSTSGAFSGGPDRCHIAADYGLCRLREIVFGLRNNVDKCNKKHNDYRKCPSSRYRIIDMFHRTLDHDKMQIWQKLCAWQCACGMSACVCVCVCVCVFTIYMFRCMRVYACMSTLSWTVLKHRNLDIQQLMIY